MKLTKERIPYFDMVYGPIHDGLTLSDILKERSSLKKAIKEKDQTLKQKDQVLKKIIQEKDQVLKKIIQEKDQALKKTIQEKDQSLLEKEKATLKAIINLFKIQNFETSQIAEILTLDIDYVIEVLKAKKLL